MLPGVSTTRILTHLPVVIGAVLAIMVWRSAFWSSAETGCGRRFPIYRVARQRITRTTARHLWLTDGSSLVSRNRKLFETTKNDDAMAAHWPPG